MIRVLAAAALAALVATAAARAEGGVEVRSCATRAEGARPLARLTEPGDVRVGPVAFRGLARFRGHPELLGRAGGHRTAKAAAVVAAGAPTVVETRYATLSYVVRADGLPVGAVELQPCPPATRAYGGGAVGRFTAFAGGFVVDRPRCVLVIVTRAERHWVRTVPVGVKRCG